MSEPPWPMRLLTKEEADRLAFTRDNIERIMLELEKMNQDWRAEREQEEENAD